MAASCLQEARQMGDGKVLKAVTMGNTVSSERGASSPGRLLGGESGERSDERHTAE